MEVYSPFNNTIKAKVKKKIAVKDLVTYYYGAYKMDVSGIFKANDFIYLCECPITYLRFFFPSELDGNDDFYKALSENEWYYQDERWEFALAIERIKEGNRILEIGSGRGNFIKRLLSEKRVDYCGLELNKEGIQLAKEVGIKLTNQYLKEHKKECKAKYDVICAFQVFEHVSAISSLFENCLELLSDNGLLIISVPNNDVGFIEENQLDSRYLNMPPHHVNLFYERSFDQIGVLFGLRAVELVKEPIQNLHVDTYLFHKVSKLFFNSSVLVRIFWKLRLHYILRPIIRLFRNSINGHTILCVYQKDIK